MYRNPLAIGSIRNHPCICGSGKKIKKCHGIESSMTMDEAKVVSELIKKHNLMAKMAKEMGNEVRS